MPTYSFTGYRWTGTFYGSPSTPAVTIDITDDDGTLDWFGDDTGTSQTATTSDGLASGSTVTGGSLLNVRMDLDNDGVEDVSEDVAFIFIAGAGWYFIPLPGSSFEEGDTLLGNNGGWVDPGEGWDYSDVICFVPGIQISTPQGPRPVESLNPGDLVITRDNGLQAVRWIGHKSISGARLQANPHLRPIRIQKDAFGPNVPDRDILVSPQHRFLLSGYSAELSFGSREVLVAAKSLLGNKRVSVEAACERTKYIHILFDNHEIITANGAETESFHPGAMGMDAIEEAARSELFEVFPELQFSLQSFGPSARKLIKVQEARACLG